MALAVRDACVAAGADAARLTLKWPNDVLLDGAKLSGLLIELTGDALLIGVGVNLSVAPEVEAYPTACLADRLPSVVTPGLPRGPSATGDACADRRRSELGPGAGAGVTTVTPATFLRDLDAAFLARMDAWRSGGFSKLRDAWLASAHGLGQPVSVRLPSGLVDGVFEDLGPTGALRLRTPDGPREITAGDVFFPGQGG